ncbi:uncharacterized protein DUF4145 [Cytobacillus horneckiae]|uniref:DUF4145 domain-containing protein n=1 Tax=Cytobacillus horneckiae TaxID=549687 RepID=UPI0019D160EB|nr:DUF4145 domain-containing protein [Cytobacillus horneckiae]MBN6889598.1 DUF4145 domain-containing protein [Cytobacillus horneckiae]MCM3180930.1 DUF4145 domain-containing protein [Cytobacillus horneckiae]
MAWLQELCKKIVEKNNLKASNISQFDRINLLYNEKIIKESVKQCLHSIRKIRNSYIHVNDGELYENRQFLIDQAVNIIITFKEVLKNTLQVSPIDYSKAFHNLISNKKMNFIDFKYRYRNILKEQNIDLQLGVTSTPRVVTSLFTAMELDIDTDDFKEITLLDLKLQVMIVIDLTIPQVENIKRLKLEVKNGILATIVSNISSIGQTEEWLLLDNTTFIEGKSTYRYIR